MRMNRLCLRIMLRLSSHRFIFSLAIAFSRFASSMRRSSIHSVNEGKMVTR